MNASAAASAITTTLHNQQQHPHPPHQHHNHKTCGGGDGARFIWHSSSQLFSTSSSSSSSSPSALPEEEEAAPEARLIQTSVEHVVAITLSRPQKKNALGNKLVSQLEAIVKQATEMPQQEARVLILHSDVPGVFCAGADLKERKGMSIDDVREFVSRLRALTDAIDSLPMPTIAALDGVALGGGLEMALACDLRVAGPEAKVALPEVRLGIIPGAGGTQRLSRVVGYSRACDLTFSGRRVNANEGVSMGLFSECAEQDASVFPAYERALKMASDIAQGAPLALRAAKRAIRASGGVHGKVCDGMAAEADAYELVLHSSDRVEALEAFAEKRKPTFEGR
eukprot:CAMPEP_0119201276 /NCGR_PEP_ID=MMETSP1316-20130426/28610_1 /TAXON_ID=41880 /ORGANISM="Pycnococcus provasolii, Strain RCC2336" /LENGTH=338 /DNA_ID=CAMNT_0007197379 /DNA_START=128 /DNA_END=1144 /DNA_ORIENTATION=+